jgi:DNA primase
LLIDNRALRNQIPMARVLDLIGYHPTSRRRHQLRGACPFHIPERPTPRCFSVELTSGLFRCFDCGAQRNQLDLWAQLRSLPLHKAALDLCQHAGVCIPVIHPDSAAR